MTEPNAPSLSATLRGLLGSLFGATVGAVVAALLEAPVAAAYGFGLLLPLALGVGVAVATCRALFLNGAAFAPHKLWRDLAELQGDARLGWLGAPPLVALFSLAWLVAGSGIAARLFASEVTGPAAFALVGFGCFPLLLASVAGARTLSSELGVRLEQAQFRPQRVLLASTVVFALSFGLLIALGETSGGGGAFKILGVFRRQELDLRAPGLLLVIALGALLMPSPRAFALVPAVLVVLPWLQTVSLARHLGEYQALRIEREAPLSRIALGLLRKVTDRDHDGVSAAFGDGDCNDHDKRVSPRAVDIPGNGIDEDCSGKDARLPPKRAVSAADVAFANDARKALPDDLNVVFVTIDTLRADLGYMGNPRPLSPSLDALAKQSVVFERAYSLASYTGKSMGPLMIGKYSSEVEGGFSHFNKYSKRETFVQERLQAAGVYTASIQGYWYFFKDAGFERGFDVIDSSAAPKVASIEGDQSSNSDEQCDAAIKLLAGPELSQRRFFLWMHLVDPHAEYAPHPEHDFGPKPRDRYDGEVAFVDAQLGRVLAALEKAPFAARTAVVVTSDHGEAFSEHGMIRHGFELWEELVRVPLLLKVPGISPKRVGARRSAIDVVPTLLDLFKLPFAARGPTDFLSGESLLADLLRPAGQADPQKPVFIDMARGPYNAERRALIDGDLKLTLSEGRVLGLYDLAEDAAEKHDLSADKARVSAMREKFAAFTSRLRPVPMPEK